MVKISRKGKATVKEQFKRIDMAINLMHGSEKEGYDKAIKEVREWLKRRYGNDADVIIDVFDKKFGKVM